MKWWHQNFNPICLNWDLSEPQKKMEQNLVPLCRDHWICIIEIVCRFEQYMGLKCAVKMGSWFRYGLKGQKLGVTKETFCSQRERWIPPACDHSFFCWSRWVPPLTPLIRISKEAQAAGVMSLRGNTAGFYCSCTKIPVKSQTFAEQVLIKDLTIKIFQLVLVVKKVYPSQTLSLNHVSFNERERK